MKKSSIALLLMLLSATMFSSCATSNTQPSSPASTKAETPSSSLTLLSPSEAASKLFADKLQIKEYTFMVEKNLRIVAYYVTNTADKDLRVNMNITAKDKAGQVLSVKQTTDQTVAPNTSVVISAWLTDVNAEDTVEYLLNASLETNTPSVAADIKLKYDIKGNKAIVTAVNEGSNTAQFVSASVIFLSKGKMVGFREEQVVRSEDELKPGDTRYAEASCAKEFDEVLIGYTAAKKK